MNSQCERDVLYRGRKFDLERVIVSGRSGTPIEREVVRHPGAVCIVPVLAPAGDGDEIRLVLIRNLRPAVTSELIEFAAGTLEPGESPASCALRELREETGYEAGSLVPIASYYTTPGMTDELMHAFLATDLRPVGQDLEESEDIAVFEATLSEVLEMIDDARFMDAKSVLALLLAMRRGMLDSAPLCGGGA